MTNRSPGAGFQARPAARSRRASSSGITIPSCPAQRGSTSTGQCRRSVSTSGPRSANLLDRARAGRYRTVLTEAGDCVGHVVHRPAVMSAAHRGREPVRLAAADLQHGRLPQGGVPAPIGPRSPSAECVALPVVLDADPGQRGSQAVRGRTADAAPIPETAGCRPVRSPGPAAGLGRTPRSVACRGRRSTRWRQGEPAHLLGTHLRITEAAAPGRMLWALTVVATAALLIVVPSMALLFVLHQRGHLEGT